MDCRSEVEMSKKKQRDQESVEGTPSPPLSEAERLALIEEWENTPSPNPEYQGKTPTEVGRLLFTRTKKDVE